MCTEIVIIKRNFDTKIPKHTNFFCGTKKRPSVSCSDNLFDQEFY